MDILDNLRYPTLDEWSQLYDRKKEAFEGLQIGAKNSSFNLLDFNNYYYGRKLLSSITEYDNRTFDLVNNYILLAYFYEKEIPDEEWYVSPGEKGGVKYFPHFKEEDHINHYWFNFYVESYYARFYGVLDHIYHMINAQYRLDLKPAIGFNRKVMNKLKHLEPSLHGYLEELKENEIMVEINDLRNDFIHNLRPNQIGDNLEWKDNEDGSRTLSFSVGKYTTTSSIMNNIELSVDLLANVNKEIKKYIRD